MELLNALVGGFVSGLLTTLGIVTIYILLLIITIIIKGE